MHRDLPAGRGRALVGGALFERCLAGLRLMGRRPQRSRGLDGALVLRPGLGVRRRASPSRGQLRAQPQPEAESKRTMTTSFHSTQPGPKTWGGGN